MCEDCKEKELDETTESLEELSEDISNDYVLPYFTIGADTYNQEKLAKGISDYSYLAGALLALVNVGGLTTDGALNYIMNKEILENTLKIAKINSDMNIEVSKNKSMLVDNSQV